MRDTGLEIIGSAPWGTHFCQFYQDKQDLIETLVPYFAAGLRQHEFCMWVTSEPLGVEEAKAALARAVGDLRPYLDSGQLEVLDYRDWYTVGGQFDSERVLQGWVDRLRAAQAKGFEGLRLTGNTFWLEQSTWRDFFEYEAAVDRVIGQYQMLAICTYSLSKCGAPELLDVMANHAFALIKRGGSWQIIESAERRRAEEARRESEERYRTLFQNMTEGFALHEIICDEHDEPVDYRFLEINPAFERLTGLKRDDIVGRTVREVLPGIESYWIETYGKVALTGEPARLEQGSTDLGRQFEAFAFWPRPRQFAVIFSDVTDRRRAEQQLLAAQRARAELAENMQAEINHRMRNNLMLLSGVLQMQLASQPEDSFAAEQLRETIARINSLSVVHEHLHAGRPGNVELSDALRRVAEIAVQALSAKEVELYAAGESVYVPSKLGSMLAILTNELITNAVKYGGPGDDGRSQIRFTLSRENGRLRLIVWNSGNPVSAGLDVTSHRGLGLQLINGVVLEQLGGRFALRPRDGGTEAEIVVPDAGADVEDAA